MGMKLSLLARGDCSTLRWRLVVTEGWTGTDPVKWAQQQKRNVNELLPRAVVAMAQLMARTLPEGGRTPYLTGNLSRSVTISAGARPNRGDGALRYTRQDFAAASVAVAGTGEAWIAYRAIYAHRVNYGFVGADSLGRVYNQSGQGFFEAAVVQWPRVLAGVIRELK